MQKKLFVELGLAPEILKAIERMGFEQASPIQSAAIPVLLEGADVVGQSQTGSGKTAAFGIPAIQAVDPDLRAPQVLILCPTRELAVQVAEEIAKLAFFKRGCASCRSTAANLTSGSSGGSTPAPKLSSAPPAASWTTSSEKV